MISPDVLERTRPRSMGRRALLILALATLLLGAVVGGRTNAALEEGLAVSVVPFAEGLEQPIFVTSGGDGSGRLYALEKLGRVRVIEADGTLLDEPLLDIGDRVLMSFEQGLLGLAFHPDFRRNGRFFMNYTAQPDGATIVSEFRVVDGRVDPAAERILLLVRQPEPIHNGGMIVLDASGQLLVGMGDGGPGGDLSDNAQDPGSLLGKIIAIDVDIEASVGPSPAIIASGLRNPWRFSLDRENGDIYIGDVGQAHWEEIDVVPAGVTGLNFGWPLLEGPQCGFSHRFCDAAAFQAPALAYPHLDGAAVIGGYVYRGSAQPKLEGLYLFADWLSGTIWAVDSEQMRAGAADPTRVGSLGARGVLTSFGEDEAGELYVVDTRGSILRVVAAGG